MVFNDPTPKQKNVLLYIKEYRKEYGYSPTYKEIGSVFKITIGTVQHHIYSLVEKGLIKIYPRARGAIPSE